MSDPERMVAFLRLNAAPGIGPVTVTRLLREFSGDPTAIFTATRSRLMAVKGIGAAAATALRDPQYAEHAQREFELAATHNIQLIGLDDPDYPPGLRAIDDPPVVLYVRGKWRDTDTLSVAIVGTRHASVYGTDQAKRFARLLAQAGFTVTSGFARGVDTAAHVAALDAGGRTVAVIGSGLLDVYPPENRSLVSRVAATGAIMSEFALEAPPHAGNFPRRNRIIAALSLGTLVVEAAIKSGAMITARLAMEYGREVFAIPGKIDSDRHRGCHLLIKEGAKLVENLDDILVELGGIGEALAAERAAERAASTAVAKTSASGNLFAEVVAGPSSSERADGDETVETATPTPTLKQTLVASLSADERTAFEAIPDDPHSVDQLAQQLQWPIHRLTAVLTMLELKGFVRQLAGRHYIRAH